MTDRAFEPADPDPFAQGHDASDSANTFAKFGPPGGKPQAPPPDNDDSGNFFAQHGFTRPAPPVSAAGAVAREAARGAIPAIGGLAPAAAGAEFGAALGAPLGPVGSLAGGLAGGIAGGYLGSSALATAQHYLLSKLPDSWVDALGMSDRQEQLDRKYHPTASFIGGLVPYALTMHPGIAPRGAVREGATAWERILAHPVAAHAFGGGLVGGMELGQEAASGEPADWGHVAIATAFGVVFNRPWGIGKTVTEWGARPARALLGQPAPAVAPAPSAEAPSAETPPSAPAGAAAPTSVEAAAPSITAAGARGELLDKLISQPPAFAAEPEPQVVTGRQKVELAARGYATDQIAVMTKAQADRILAVTLNDLKDLKIAGPGIPKTVHEGSEDQNPQAEQAARADKQNELMATRRAQENARAAARRADPDTFAEYDRLQGARTLLDREIRDINNPPDELVAHAAAQRDRIQQQLDAHLAARGGYAGGREARVLRAQLGAAQRDLDSLAARREAFASGTAAQDEDLQAKRLQLQQVDFALRDLHPRIQGAIAEAAQRGGALILPPGPIEPPQLESEVMPNEASRTTPAVDRLAMPPSDETRAPSPAAAAAPAINRNHDIPYLAGTSNDGATVYIDRRVPTELTVKGKTFDPAPFLAVHERTEHGLMVRRGESYETAHREALKAERDAVEDAGIDWPGYQAEMARLAGATEHEQAKVPPADLYTKPYPHAEAEFLKREGETAPAAEPVPALTPAPPEPVAPAPPAKPIDYREAIRASVEGEFTAAGRPREEADLLGRLLATHYDMFARIFEGRLGNALNIYRGETYPEVLGPGRRSKELAAERVRKPRKVDEDKLSLGAWLARKGGLKPTPDLEYVGAKGIPGLLKSGPNAMTADRALEVAIEAGYIQDIEPSRTGGVVNRLDDLYDAIREEAKGNKRYRIGKEPTVEREQPEEEFTEGMEPDEAEELTPEAPSALMKREDYAVLQRMRVIPGIHIGEIFSRPGELHQIKAYHGSPHDFERFDISKIGTGEGAQAFGHGLYFAENEGVARSYKLAGQPAWMGPTVHGHIDTALQTAKANGLDGSEARKFAIDYLNKQANNAPPGVRQQFYDAINNFDQLASRGAPGRMYQVAIKADPEHFLDWDKRLRQQPKKLQALVNQLAQERNDYGNGPFSQLLNDIGGKLKNVSGQDIVHALEAWERDNGKSVASDKLRDAGIPGIRYLDQGSRAAADGTLARMRADRDELLALLPTTKDTGIRQSMQSKIDAWNDYIRQAENPTYNYVVFDDKLIDITHKDGQALTPQERTELLQSLAQTARGSVLFRGPDMRPILRLTKDQDASTPLHEVMGHIFLNEMMHFAARPDAPPQLKHDAATTLKWLGVPDAAALDVNHPDEAARRTAVVAHERFANGTLQYIHEGVAPSPELASIFARFSQWLRGIYDTILSIKDSLVHKEQFQHIDDAMRMVYHRLFVEEPHPTPTVIAPEEPRQPILSAEHREDARATPPDHADAAMARVDNEADQWHDDMPEEVRREFETAEARFHAGHEGEGAAAGPADVGAADTEHPGQAGQVHPPGGGPESEPGGATRGGEPETQLRGGPEPRPEGAGVAERPGGQGGEGQGRPAPAGDMGLAPVAAARFEAPGFNLGKEGNIRVENITSVAAFQAAIEESAQRIGGDGPTTMGQMLNLAAEIEIDPASISEAKLAGLFGGAVNLAPKIQALRQALRDSAEVVHTAMQAVRDDASDANVAEFAKVVARHDMMQSVLSSVTTEVGRGLGMAFRNLEGWQKAENLGEFLKANTGRTLFQLKALAKLGSQLDSAGKVSKFLRDAEQRSGGGMLLEYFINNLISGLATHVTYIFANRILDTQKAVPETLLAAAIGSLRGRSAQERVYAGEAAAQLRSMWWGDVPKAAQAFLEGGTTGRSVLLPEEKTTPGLGVRNVFQGDTALSIARSITNDPVTWREFSADLYGAVSGMLDGIKSGAALVAAGGHAGAPLVGLHWSPLGHNPDIAIRGVPAIPVGSLIRLPSRGVTAIHSYFRVSGYSYNIAALAYRDATARGLTGQAFADHVAQFTASPPAAAMEHARTSATESTLMAEGGEIVKRLSALINTPLRVPFLGNMRILKFIDPFVHIGSNIINQAIIQRTPIGILSPEVYADLTGANGAIRQDMAQARMLAGTTMALGFGALAMQGYITGSGPSDPGDRATWLGLYQPHSVRIGDIWYQANRLGPMGMLLSIAADMYDVAHDASEGDMLKMAAHFQHAVTQNILDESFMRGPSDLIKAVEDPGRYGEGYLKGLVSSFVPFSVGLAQMARAADPYALQARTVVDEIRRKVPGHLDWAFENPLYPVRDTWGEPLPSPDAFGHAGLTAIHMKRVNGDPVNQAMFDLGIKAARPERKIRGIDLTDQQYDDFTRMAGRMAKLRLDTIVRSPDWQMLPTGIRHDVIAKNIEGARESARGMVMMKYPMIPQQAGEARRKRAAGE
jgi:hypothetical protein